MAVPHWPFISVRTKASAREDASTYCPPAAHAPPGAHDTEFTPASLITLARTAEFAVAETRVPADTGATAVQLAPTMLTITPAADTQAACLPRLSRSLEELILALAFTPDAAWLSSRNGSAVVFC